LLVALIVSTRINLRIKSWAGIVHNEQQLTDQPTPIGPGRGLILKYTHMLAF
jgi:hypothetical protein